MNIDSLIKEIFKNHGIITKVDISILIETILSKYFDKNKIKYKKRKMDHMILTSHLKQISKIIKLLVVWKYLLI